jgi:hypothetical protein
VAEAALTGAEAPWVSPGLGGYYHGVLVGGAVAGVLAGRAGQHTDHPEIG